MSEIPQKIRPLSGGAGPKREAVTVERFLATGGESLRLKLVAGGKGLGDLIPEAAVHRPGLALAGYYRHFSPGRLQIIGRHEHAYLTDLGPAKCAERLRQLFARNIPGLIVCRDLPVSETTLELADSTSTPLFTSSMETCHLINSATLMMANMVSLHEVVHGTMIEVFGLGVLLVGEAGIGKSETALGLIRRGHTLVADDTTRLRRESTGRIVASAVAPIENLMEIRSIGIVHIPALFGIAAIRGDKQLDLVMTLEKPAKAEPYVDRTGETKWFREVLGVRIPEVVVPVAPGRDMVNMVETTVCEFKLRSKGFHAAKFLDKRIFAQQAGESAPVDILGL